MKHKHIGQIYNGWTVEKRELAYQKNKLKTFRYYLTRVTSDSKCKKTVSVSHKTMARIASGKTTVDQVIENKLKLKSRNNYTFRNSVFYRFINSKTGENNK